MTHSDLTLTTFTDKEVDAIEHALQIAANAIEHSADDLRRGWPHVADEQYQQAHALRDLLLKIQANR